MAFLVRLNSGPKFTVYAFADNRGRCKVWEFLEKNNHMTVPDRDRLSYLMNKMAADGVITDDKKCKHLKEGIFEFKAAGGARLLWFYDREKIVIASHGFIKKRPKAPRSEIEAAIETRKYYLEAKRHENVRTLSSFEELPKA